MTQILGPLTQTRIVNNSPNTRVTTRPIVFFFSSTASADDGSSILLVVKAIGGNLQYQWQVSTDGGTVWADISGANGSTYLFGPATLGDDGTLFRVIISNLNGNTITNPVTLSVVSVGPGPSLTELFDSGDPNPILPAGTLDWTRAQSGNDAGGGLRQNGFAHITWQTDNPRPSGGFPDAGEGYIFERENYNDIDFSEDLTGTGWTTTNTTIGSNLLVPPSEDVVTSIADTLIDDATAGVHSIEQITPNASLGERNLLVFAKQNSGTRHLRLEMQGSSIDPGAWAQFNLSDGSIESQGVDAGIVVSELFPSGGLNWRRFLLTTPQRGIAGPVTNIIKMLDGSFSDSYSGDGSSIALFGAQAFNGSFWGGVPSYVRTPGAGNVTIGVDQVSLSNPAACFPQFNQPFTVFGAYKFPGGTYGRGAQQFFTIWNFDLSQRIRVAIGDDFDSYNGNTGDLLLHDTGDGGDFVGEKNLGDAGSEGSFAITSDGSTTRFFKNGIFNTTGVHGATANACGAIDFNDGFTGGPFILRLFRIYDSELSDSEVTGLHDAIFNP